MALKNDQLSLAKLLNIILSGVILYAVYNNLICGYNNDKLFIAIAAVLLFYSIYSLFIYSFEFLFAVIVIAAIAYYSFKWIPEISNIEINHKIERKQ
jgi:hypothetical protein